MQAVLAQMNVECDKFHCYIINLHSINGPPDKTFQTKKLLCRQSSKESSAEQRRKKRKQSPTANFETKKIDATQKFIDLSCGKIESLKNEDEFKESLKMEECQTPNKESLKMDEFKSSSPINNDVQELHSTNGKEIISIVG